MKIYRKPLLLSIPALLFSIALNVPAQTKFGNDYIWQIAPSDYSTKIIGTWRLVRVEIINSDGRKRPPYGASPIGRIVFDSRSRFTILCIATTDQNDKDAHIALFGTYSVDEAERTLTWRIRGTTSPKWSGPETRLLIDFLTDEELRVSVTRESEGTLCMHWKREIE